MDLRAAQQAEGRHHQDETILTQNSDDTITPGGQDLMDTPWSTAGHEETVWDPAYPGLITYAVLAPADSGHQLRPTPQLPPPLSSLTKKRGLQVRTGQITDGC